MHHGTLLISVPAQADLHKVWNTIAEHDLGAADRMLDLLLERANLLADFPNAGRARPELGRALRSLAVDPYVILYRPEERGVAVVRVIHTAQDIDLLFPEHGEETE